MCISRMTVTIISRLILNLRYEARERSFLSMSEPTIKLPTFFNNSLGDITQINTQVSRYSSWISQAVDELETESGFMSSFQSDSIEGRVMEVFSEYESDLIRQDGTSMNQWIRQTGVNHEIHFSLRRTEEILQWPSPLMYYSLTRS